MERKGIMLEAKLIKTAKLSKNELTNGTKKVSGELKNALDHPATRPIDTSLTRPLPLASDQALRRRFMVMDETLEGNFRFGLLLEILDKMAEETALNYVNRFYPEARVVTAAIDKILVHNPIDVTRDIVFSARINHVGRSSLEIGIRVEQLGEPVIHIASCYFTMVARSGIGEEAVSVMLPPLEYTDEIEQKRARKTMSRRDDYKQQQALLLEPPSRDEFEMFIKLHQDQDDPGLVGRRAHDEPRFRGLRASRLVTESWEMMYPEQENVPKKIFGGYLIRRAFELSSICCELVAPDRPIVVAVNRINFLQPVRMGDKLHYTSRVVYTNDSYVCVESSIERISRDRTSKALSNSCFFTFVNIDREMARRQVPSIYPSNYAEDARYLAAHRSHQILAKEIREI